MGVRVLCLRHAESENVVAGVAGALPPAELTLKGRAQAAEAGERLRGEGVTRIYASTAVRARQTAEIIARALGLREEVVAGHPPGRDSRPPGSAGRLRQRDRRSGRACG
ncbi:histidine phosphatase family protein [Nonomuraea sp. NPDC003201]